MTKNTLTVLIMMLASAFFNNAYAFKTNVVEIEQHKYIVAETDDSKSISIIHAESCKCKNEKDKKSDQGPRLFPKTMRLKKYDEQNGICPHCTNHFEFVQMQGDHIIPYSKGGKTEYSNLQMLCIQCNQKKSNKYSY